MIDICCTHVLLSVNAEKFRDDLIASSYLVLHIKSKLTVFLKMYSDQNSRATVSGYYLGCMTSLLSLISCSR